MERIRIMTLNEAQKIIGNQPLWAVRNMEKALSLIPWLNTEEEGRRLQAARIVLRSKEKE